MSVSRDIRDDISKAQKSIPIVVPPRYWRVRRSQHILSTGRNTALGSTQAGIQMDRMPGTRTRFVVAITTQRIAVWTWLRTIRVNVIAKATFAQLVAIVVIDVDVFW